MIRRFFKGTGSVIRYIRGRLFEKSTLAGVIAGIPVAATLPYPWSVLSIVGGLALALYPEKKNRRKDDPPEGEVE